MSGTRQTTENVTALLAAWRDGDETALDRLAPVVYDELRGLARWHLRRERTGHTLQATALVNEVYLRLVDVKSVHWQGRAHFFALASRMMRRILVDAARARGYKKRGGGAGHVMLDEAVVVSSERLPDFVALNDALDALEAFDARRSRVVEMRFFGGLTAEETAEVLGVSPDTVKRDWRLAKAWLLGELKGQKQRDG